MSVTLIIVNWNGASFIGRCLEAVAQLSCKADRVIVVDNHSSDASLEIIRRFAWVEVIANDSNTGFAAANNQALARVDSEYVALLNPDAFPEPDWLGQLLAAAQDQMDVGTVGSLQLCGENPLLVDGLEDRYHLSGLFWRKGFGKPLSSEMLQTRDVFSACAAAALYRTRAIVEVGGFDEHFFCYGEDVDLGFRLQLAGYRAIFCPEAVVHHLGSATTGSQKSDFAVYHGHRNLVWVFLKNMPGGLLWCLLPLHLLMTLAVLLRFAARGQGRIVLKSKLDAVREIGRVWRQRQVIQDRRHISLRALWRLLDKTPFGRCPQYQSDSPFDQHDARATTSKRGQGQS